MHHDNWRLSNVIQEKDQIIVDLEGKLNDLVLRQDSVTD